jgi:hypothetical protein
MKVEILLKAGDVSSGIRRWPDSTGQDFICDPETGKMRMQVDEDEYERRLRLVLLTYEVLEDMETPTDEATSAAMFFLLSRAFFDKPPTLANLEAASLRGEEPTRASPRASTPRGSTAADKHSAGRPRVAIPPRVLGQNRRGVG